MKPKFLLALSFILFAFKSFSQNNDEISFGVYRWNNNVPLTQCDRSGTISNIPGTATPIKKDAESGQLFKIVEFISGSEDAIIQILDYTGKSGGNIIITSPEKFYKFNYNGQAADYNGLSVTAKNSREYTAWQIYFRVSKNIIKSNASKQLDKGIDLAVGALTLPLKMRLSDGDFTGSISIAGTGGIKWRASKYNETRYHNILIGLGLSNITLDTNTVSKNKDKLVNNLSALTFCTGYMYQTGKVQAGLFIGWDFLTHSNQDRFSWRYQGKPWFSLAFGISIFGDGNETPKKQPESQPKPQ